MARTAKPRPKPPFDELRIVVRGKIGSWQRPKETKPEKGKSHRFVAREVESYLGQVSQEAGKAMGPIPPLGKPYAFEMSVLAVYPIPESWSPQKRREAEAGIVPRIEAPDLDNGAIKGIFDALQQIVYVNDSQIVCLGRCLKVYGAMPRLEILLTVVDRIDPILPASPVYEQPDLFGFFTGEKDGAIAGGPAGDP
jgi:Holliday junction resolvase RusA-like endonuclease